MASQSPFFGKRTNETDLTSRPAPLVGSPANLTGNPVTPASLNPQAAANANAPAGSGAKLTVGPNIKLKGVEITDCDTLVVEGTVEATMDSRVIQIAESGAFKGSVEIDIAEIRGQFDGNLTVRDKLVIHATGRVTGKIRYGKIVIEEGGQLSGDISVGGAGARSDSKPEQKSDSKQQPLHAAA